MLQMDESMDQACYKWTDAAISKLIQLRYERREDFGTVGKRSRDVWLSIVRDLGLENQITADECSEQWSHLLAKFKDMERKIADGSCSEELGWPHYNQMQSIISKLEDYEDPKIILSGNAEEVVEIQFSDANDHHVPNGDGSSEHRSNRRDRQSEIDERFISAVEEGNRQLEKMNLIAEKQGDMFLELMTRFVAIIEGQATDETSME